MQASGDPNDPITDVTWRAGVLGTIPGSVSGAQTVEAFHREWETQVRPWDLRATLMLSWPTCNRWCPDGCRKVACSDLEKYALADLVFATSVRQTGRHGAIVVIGGTTNQFVVGFLDRFGAEITAHLKGQSFVEEVLDKHLN